MTLVLDDKDFQIIEQLVENARYSTREIAKRAGIPSTTVLSRIKKLEEEGVITRYAAKLDYKKLGFSIICYVMVEVYYPYLQSGSQTHEGIAKLIARYPFVSCVSSLAGHKDILLRVRARDVTELNKFVTKLGQVAGVMKTETNLVLTEIQRNADRHKDVIKMARDRDFADKVMEMG